MSQQIPGDASSSRDTASMDAHSLEEKRILVVTGLSQKNRRHYGPLADVAGEVTMVSLEPTYAVEDARYVPVPEIGPRPLRLLVLFVVALLEGYRREYDAVASISLVPYGIYALLLKAVYGYPAHLGIIGIDLDHHAEASYGGPVRWLFRRFDAVSVPGPSHAFRLAAMGVDSDRIEILTNAIDTDTYRPLEDAEGSVGTDSVYDFIWVGRFSAEKAPHRFVDALEVLADDGYEFRAAMVGNGALWEAVADDIDARGLEDRISLPGWADEPVEYYRQADTFVCTSSRDALPLVMLEAMATGLTPIVPQVGSIPDVVSDGENALLLDCRDPETIAAAMARSLEDPAMGHKLGANAAEIRHDFSFARASEDWVRILSTLER